MQIPASPLPLPASPRPELKSISSPLPVGSQTSTPTSDNSPELRLSEPARSKKSTAAAHVSLFETSEPSPPVAPRRASDKQGTLSVGWGYGRQFYGPSDMHFSGQGHDFRLQGVRAYDRPSAFSFDTYFNPAKLSIPQYMADITYFPTDRSYVELNPNHHMKWVADLNQMAQVTGTIDASLSPELAGTHDNSYIPMRDMFTDLEHSDGYNYVHAGAGIIQPLLESRDGKHAISLKAGVHAGGLVTKTKAIMFDQGADHPFKLCGIGYGTKVGVRVDLFRNFFVEGNSEFIRGHLDGFKTTGKPGDQGAQTINGVNNYFTVGVNIPVNRK